MLLYSFLQNLTFLSLLFGKLSILFLLGQVGEVFGRGYQIEQQVVMPTMGEGTTTGSSQMCTEDAVFALELFFLFLRFLFGRLSSGGRSDLLDEMWLFFLLDGCGFALAVLFHLNKPKL